MKDDNLDITLLEASFPETSKGIKYHLKIPSSYDNFKSIVLKYSLSWDGFVYPIHRNSYLDL